MAPPCSVTEKQGEQVFERPDTASASPLAAAITSVAFRFFCYRISSCVPPPSSFWKLFCPIACRSWSWSSSFLPVVVFCVRTVSVDDGAFSSSLGRARPPSHPRLGGSFPRRGKCFTFRCFLGCCQVLLGSSATSVDPQWHFETATMVDSRCFRGAGLCFASWQGREPVPPASDLASLFFFVFLRIFPAVVSFEVPRGFLAGCVKPQ